MTEKDKKILSKTTQIIHQAVMDISSTHPYITQAEAEELSFHIQSIVQKNLKDVLSSTSNRKKIQKPKDK